MERESLQIALTIIALLAFTVLPYKIGERISCDADISDKWVFGVGVMFFVSMCIALCCTVIYGAYLLAGIILTKYS